MSNKFPFGLRSPLAARLGCQIRLSSQLKLRTVLIFSARSASSARSSHTFAISSMMALSFALIVSAMRRQSFAYCRSYSWGTPTAWSSGRGNRALSGCDFAPVARGAKPKPCLLYLGRQRSVTRADSRSIPCSGLSKTHLPPQTGPGTPMGEMFRRYWIPAMHAEELPENECPPVRVKLLSERLLAWRDTQGRYALTDEFCAHRGVSLWFGRNEHNGLRCPYHGWKYDHTGQCIEVPSEPTESGFCQQDQVEVLSADRARRDSVGLYGAARVAAAVPGVRMGDAAGGALLQHQAAAGVQLPPGDGGRHRFQPRLVPALRRHAPRSAPPQHQGRALPGRPEAEVRDRGIRRAACSSRRGATPRPGHYYWRITQWIMPWYTMVPPYGHNALNAHAWVPIDDENCFTWTFTYHPTRPLSATWSST